MLVAATLTLALAPAPPIRGARLARAAVAPLTAPAFVALPAYADGSFDGVVGTVFNVGLSAVLLALLAYVGKFAAEAVAEVGSQAGGRLDLLKGDGDGSPRSSEPLFDDSGTGADYSPVQKRQKRMVSEADIARMAPWMAGKIDQDKIEESKKKRAQRLKREGKR